MADRKSVRFTNVQTLICVFTMKNDDSFLPPLMSLGIVLRREKGVPKAKEV